jgi:hypothetical protein
MNRWIILVGWTLALLTACSKPNQNAQEQGEQAAVQEKAEEEMFTSPACYLYATEMDTVYLVLNPAVAGKVTGDLSYDFFERDGNIGFIEGEVQGDTLIADYTFLSEGMVSVREVGFLLGEDQVMEGYGDVEQVDGRMVFWHKDSLDFSNGLVMRKVSCEQIKQKDYTQFFPDSIIHQRNATRR